MYIHKYMKTNVYKYINTNVLYTVIYIRIVQKICRRIGVSFLFRLHCDYSCCSAHSYMRFMRLRSVNSRQTNAYFTTRNVTSAPQREKAPIL